MTPVVDKEKELVRLENILIDAYKMKLELKCEYDRLEPRDQARGGLLLSMAMVRAKITIIKKKIRDL